MRKICGITQLSLFGFVDNANILQLYDKKLEFNPNCADTWNRKGDMLYSLSKFEKAKECYDKAIQLEPNNIWGYHSKECTLESLGQTDDSRSCSKQASRIFKDLLNKSGKLPSAYIFLIFYAQILDNKESYEEAVEYIDKALEIEPKKAYIWKEKGGYFNEMSKWQEAIECFEKACTYELGKNYLYLCNKGLALTQLLQYEEAI